MSPKERGHSQQMSASVAAPQRAPTDHAPRAFGRIGIPAVAAAAEMLKPRKPVERPFHETFFMRIDD